MNRNRALGTKRTKCSKGLLIAAAAVFLLGVSGCGSTESDSQAETDVETSTGENPYGGFPVDPPAPDEVVLTINGENTKDYTMSELEAMSTIEFTIQEPFVERTEIFQGIPLKNLFEENGIRADQDVVTVALNDYRYADSVEAFATSDGLLAVSRNGEPIPMDQGGPIRIIFPEGSPYFTFLDAWNWSLRSIELSNEVLEKN